MIAWLELAVVGVAAWWLGVCSMALWQNWKARPAPLIAVDLLPRQLVEEIAARSEQAESRSPFAPKPKPRKVEAPLRARANKLKHWPRAIAEKETPPAMVRVEATRPTHTVLPFVEFGNGVSR